MNRRVRLSTGHALGGRYTIGDAGVPFALVAETELDRDADVREATIGWLMKRFMTSIQLFYKDSDVALG